MRTKIHQSVNPTTKRPRPEIADSDDDEPIAQNMQRCVKPAIVTNTGGGGVGYMPTSPVPNITPRVVKQAIVVDVVITKPSPSVTLTAGSTEAKEKVTSFVEYVDRVVVEKEHFEKIASDQTRTITTLRNSLVTLQEKSELLKKSEEKNRDLFSSVKYLDGQNAELSASVKNLQEANAGLSTAVKDLKEKNARLTSDVEVEANRATAAERRATDVVRLRLQIDAMENSIQSTKDLFYDPVAMDYATCPILLSNGRIFGFTTITDFWLHSEFFNGKVDGLFICPLSREAIRVADITAVDTVAKIGENLGLNSSMPFSFEFDTKHTDPDATTAHVPNWSTYSIQSQLVLFAALVGLYRDRQYGPNSRVLQINDTHTATIKMGAGVMVEPTWSHVYKVELSLTVVENVSPRAHNIRYVTSSREQNKLLEFELPTV
jgi:hypothetical protein